MKIAQNVFKKGIDVVKKYGLTFDTATGKYYFANIKTNKEEYLLFLIFDYREDDEEILINKYAFFNKDTKQLEDITAADINNIIIKYFELQLNLFCNY